MGQKISHPSGQTVNKNGHNPRRSEVIEIVYEDEQDYDTAYEDGMKSGDSCPTQTGSPRLSETTHTFSPKTQVIQSPQTDNKRKTFHFRSKDGSRTVPFSYYEPALSPSSNVVNRNIELPCNEDYRVNERKTRHWKINLSLNSKSFDNQSDTVSHVGDQDSDATEFVDRKTTPIESETCYHEFSSLSPLQETNYGVKTSFQDSNLVTHSRTLSEFEWCEFEQKQTYEGNFYHRFVTNDLPSKIIYSSAKDISPTEFLSSSCDVCSQFRRNLISHGEQKRSKPSPTYHSNGHSQMNTVVDQAQNSPIVELSFAMNEISSEFLDPSVHNGSVSEGTCNWTKYYVGKTNRMVQNEAYATRFLARHKKPNEKDTKLDERGCTISRLTGHSSNTSTVDLRKEPAEDGKALNNQPSSNISITARSASWCSRKSPSLVLFTLRPVMMLDNYELSPAKESRLNVHKKIGLTNLEGCYVGGNVTSIWRQNEAYKCDSTTPKSSQCDTLVKNVLSPISRPIHVYSYRFWVTNGPSIDNIFKNPHDRRIESIGRLSDCRIRLTRNMRRNHQGFIQRMVNIIAPSGPALQKCCKLFDDKFPEFYASSGLLMKGDELTNPSNFGIRPGSARPPKRHKPIASSLQSRPRKRSSNQLRKIRKSRSTDYNDTHSFGTHRGSLDIVNLINKC